MILNAPEGFRLAKWRTHVFVRATSAGVSLRMIPFSSNSITAFSSSGVVFQVFSEGKGIFVSGSFKPRRSTCARVVEDGTHWFSVARVRRYGAVRRHNELFFSIASSSGS